MMAVRSDVHRNSKLFCLAQAVVRNGRAITAGVPDYRQLDFAPLPQPAASILPNGIVASRPADRVLEGEDAAAQQALSVQVLDGVVYHSPSAPHD